MHHMRVCVDCVERERGIKTIVQFLHRNDGKDNFLPQVLVMNCAEHMPPLEVTGCIYRLHVRTSATPFSPRPSTAFLALSMSYRIITVRLFQQGRPARGWGERGEESDVRRGSHFRRSSRGGGQGTFVLQRDAAVGDASRVCTD